MYNVQCLSRMLPISVMSNVKTTTFAQCTVFPEWGFVGLIAWP